MSHDLAVLERPFEVHGIDLRVSSEETAVIEAMELRLRDFRSQPAPGPELRLEFRLDSGDGWEPPSSRGRPVYDTRHGSLHYFPDTDALWGQFGGVRLQCDAARGIARFFSDAFVGEDLYLATHPLSTVSLMELLERRGLYSLHAAGLASADGRGVLLAGPSGSGKSTLAVAMALAGMAFLSDDMVFLSSGSNGRPRAFGFADTLGLTESTLGLFGELRHLAHAAPPFGFPKHIQRIEELTGRPAVSDARPTALVFPEIGRGQLSQISPLDPREAMLRLVPDVLVTEPESTQEHLRVIAALLEHVECYVLRSGRDLPRAVELVQTLL